MSTFNPQKMLVAEFDRPVYRGCHSPFTQLVRRYDDPKTPSSTGPRVGAVPVLRGWLALKLSPCVDPFHPPFALAEKTWSHPVTGRDFRVAAGTVACWYYMALRHPDDRVGALAPRRAQRLRQIWMSTAIAERLHLQYRNHPDWSYQLHYDNLAALLEADPSPGQLRSYSTVKATCRLTAWLRRPRPSGRPAEARAEERRQAREIRSYEAEHVGALWHLDFHHGSRKVLTPGGQWQRPIALGILDDHSRLCCHVQWYLSETAEDLVHGFSQAIQKRFLPPPLDR